MALSIKPYKGARDFYPEDKRAQKYLFSVMRTVVESYGYEEYDAPILESLELYKAKTGEEIVNEQTYTFTDRGGREVAIRPEMTPTVSRMVAARRQESAYPLRLYSIPNLWRYERPQRGRLREHWQLNVDIFGVNSQQADIELIHVANDIFKAYGALPEMYEIRLNSRTFVDAVLHKYLAVDEGQAHALIKLIDRIRKIEKHIFVAQLADIMGSTDRADEVLTKLEPLLTCRDISALPTVLREYPELTTIENILHHLDAADIHNAFFDFSLMRGFDYYTDIVFEVFDTHPDNNRSMMGGGRYDGLVGLFGVAPLPTVGFGLGDATLLNFLELHDIMPDLAVETDVYVIVVGAYESATYSLIAELRRLGIKAAVDYSGKKIGDQLKIASKKNIGFALIVGEQEIKKNIYQLKQLTTGDDQLCSPSQVVTLLKAARQTA